METACFWMHDCTVIVASGKLHALQTSLGLRIVWAMCEHTQHNIYIGIPVHLVTPSAHIFFVFLQLADAGAPSIRLPCNAGHLFSCPEHQEFLTGLPSVPSQSAACAKHLILGTLLHRALQSGKRRHIPGRWSWMCKAEIENSPL